MVATPTRPDHAISESSEASELEQALRWRVSGDVRFDQYNRMLYSTDASNYQIEPVGVVMPRTVDDLRVAIAIAIEHGVPVLPRGGGSSLAGQTVGTALVIDTSKYLKQILDLDISGRSVRVQPGIVLSNLNAKLARHGLMFGPDPASADRATIGGVVGNNSSGSHSILYGMTKDHLTSIHGILSDGTELTFDRQPVASLSARAEGLNREGQLFRGLLGLRERYGAAIERDFPKHWRRASGYNLPELIAEDGIHLARLLAGSEGTLAFGTEFTMQLVPRPKMTALVVLQFDDLVQSMESVSTILECGPSAVELMDKLLIDLTRQQPGYAREIAFIKGDPEAFLCVEFYGESASELQSKVDNLVKHLAGIEMSQEPLVVYDPKQQAGIWAVRKAGQGLLMSIRGDYKPISGIEDVSVPVPQLPSYVREIKRLIEAEGTRGAFYAHASAGCLHVRPLINLKSSEGVQSLRRLTEEAADLAIRFGGVMSGEHSDGLARGELNPRLFGPELYRCMEELKAAFDPDDLMNPGKIVNCPPLDQNLRYGAGYRTTQIRTHLSFEREGGFDRAVEMCSGTGVCRKLGSGTMCPSYMATHDERDTTRARANALRAALSGRLLERNQLMDQGTYDVLDLCISCKACKTECPQSVDMTKIKTEFLAQYHDVHGTPLRSKVFGHIHTLNLVGSKMAPLANLMLRTPLTNIGKRAIGVHPAREIAPFATQTFEAWFAEHKKSMPAPKHGIAVYFHDTFTNYNYPQIGIATVTLLEAAGYGVEIVARRACCGRPMLSKGLVEEARKLARKNIDALAPYARKGYPIVGTEPSCILTLRDEYLDLFPNDPAAKQVAEQSLMFDEFLSGLADRGELDITWKREPGPKVLFHGHCHQKAIIGMKPSMALLAAAGCQGEESGAGCCGMAGSFGYEVEHYEISRKIGAERLFPKVESQDAGTIVAVAGVSCREQIGHFTRRKPIHLAEVLASRVAG